MDATQDAQERALDRPVMVFLGISIAWILFVVTLLSLVRDDGFAQALYAIRHLSNVVVLKYGVLLGSFCIALLVAMIFQRGSRYRMAVRLLLIFIGVFLFQPGFTLFKSTMPYITPFFADPFFAELDRLLHFGTDPWELTYSDIGRKLFDPLIPIYLKVWAPPALLLPIMIVATDRDPQRVSRFLRLYIFVWAFMGGAIALSGLSVGPVFYDRIIDGNRFGGLTAALNASEAIQAEVAKIQTFLWVNYAERHQSLASGISAFPSIHVATSVLFALYIYERLKWMLVPMIVYVLIIQILSVHTGYHYAIDGYFSIIFLMSVWAWMRRKEQLSQGKCTV